jgi:4-carboxymuconolactone decarboxylase
MKASRKRPNPAALPQHAQARRAQAQPAVLPEDVYPESGFRLPLPKRDDLDEEGKQMCDVILNPKTNTFLGLKGPLGIQLYSPPVAKLDLEMNEYLRFHAGFGARVRELAILVTAREADSQFEWGIHEEVALKEGLEQKLIDVVKYRKVVSGLPEMEAVVIQLGRQMLGKKKVSAELFARALKLFGARGLVEVVSLMGHYWSKAALIAAFHAVDMQPGKRPLLPPLRRS